MRQILETAPTNSAEDPQATQTSAVRDYWDAHTLGLQYVKDPDVVPGSRAFFDHIRPWMSPFKFPWLMQRIEREAALLRGKRLLEVGCGMGYVSLEFIRRGVRVTATDLTPQAINLTRRHFALENVHAEDVRVENALSLSFPDDSFDAVWANGVVHATGDTAGAIREIRRVLKPGGRAIISHFYRRGSWMHFLHRLGRENVEFKEEDPPVNEWYTDREVLDMFDGFEVVEAVREHYRALPVARHGIKALLYSGVFRPTYNRLPEGAAKALAYKFSVTAVKKPRTVE